MRRDPLMKVFLTLAAFGALVMLFTGCATMSGKTVDPVTAFKQMNPEEQSLYLLDLYKSTDIAYAKDRAKWVAAGRPDGVAKEALRVKKQVLDETHRPILLYGTNAHQGLPVMEGQGIELLGKLLSVTGGI